MRKNREDLRAHLFPVPGLNQEITEKCEKTRKISVQIAFTLISRTEKLRRKLKKQEKPPYKLLAHLLAVPW